MHEMALTESLLGLVEQQARQHHATAVTAVRVEVGVLSTVEPESLQFCFDAIKAHYPIAATAVLELLMPPGQAFCLSCTDTVTIARRGDPCPRCGHYGLHVTAGDDLRLVDMEIT